MGPETKALLDIQARQLEQLEIISGVTTKKPTIIQEQVGFFTLLLTGGGNRLDVTVTPQQLGIDTPAAITTVHIANITAGVSSKRGQCWVSLLIVKPPAGKQDERIPLVQGYVGLPVHRVSAWGYLELQQDDNFVLQTLSSIVMTLKVTITFARSSGLRPRSWFFQPDFSINSNGFLTTATATGAGNTTVVLAVPQNRRWRLQGFRIRVVTDATVVTRNLNVALTDGVPNNLWADVQGPGQAASLTRTTYYAPSTSLLETVFSTDIDGVGVGLRRSMPSAWYMLVPTSGVGWDIRATLGAGVAGDTMTILAAVEEWMQQS